MKAFENIYRLSPIPLQTLFLNLKAIELYFERYGRKFRKIFEEFDKNQWLTRSELDSYQDEHLRRIVNYAYETVPYYSEKMRSLKLHPDDIKSKADLPK